MVVGSDFGSGEHWQSSFPVGSHVRLRFSFITAKSSIYNLLWPHIHVSRALLTCPHAVKVRALVPRGAVAKPLVAYFSEAGCCRHELSNIRVGDHM